MHGGKRKIKKYKLNDMQPVVNDVYINRIKTKTNEFVNEINENQIKSEPIENLDESLNNASVINNSNDKCKQPEDDIQVTNSRSSKDIDGDDNIYDDNGNITQKKKKSDSRKPDNKKQIINQSRSKSKREPLPMKLRALPQSFWQQPNNMLCQETLGTVCPALPIICKEEIAECLITTEPTTSDENVAENQPKQIVTHANTDLLFSLFRVVEEEQRRNSGQIKVKVVKRGRPKKLTVSNRGALKDDDPCLVSTVTEALLPLLPERKTRDTSSVQVQIEQGQQALAMASLNNPEISMPLPPPPPTNSDHNYSNLLTEVAFRL